MDHYPLLFIRLSIDLAILIQTPSHQTRPSQSHSNNKQPPLNLQLLLPRHLHKPLYTVRLTTFHLSIPSPITQRTTSSLPITPFQHQSRHVSSAYTSSGHPDSYPGPVCPLSALPACFCSPASRPQFGIPKSADSTEGIMTRPAGRVLPGRRVRALGNRNAKFERRHVSP
ncbi:hypothetical protein VTK56DRAFT_3391 [Thermocarpiscus australiensis]